ncbi:Uncharacterised protein [Vibrio cholerae]|nr:Uncharacterised protein [Vibrio cholerae]
MAQRFCQFITPLRPNTRDVAITAFTLDVKAIVEGVRHFLVGLLFIFLPFATGKSRLNASQRRFREISQRLVHALAKQRHQFTQ